MTLRLLLLIITFACASVSAEEKEDDSDSEPASAATLEENSVGGNTRRALPFPHASQSAAVIDFLRLNQRQHEAISLIAEQQNFYGLFLRERSGQPQGGALILHDLEQHSHWPQLVAPLREQLPEHGWTTLAIELPVKGRIVISPQPEPAEDNMEEAAEETTDTSDDISSDATENGAADSEEAEIEEPEVADQSDDGADNDTTPPDDVQAAPSEPADSDTEANAANTDDDDTVTGETLRQRFADDVRARILAGTNYLAERGQLNLVVIATGDSAVWAADVIQNRQRDNENARGIALVMIDAREHPASQLRLAQVLEQLDIPVLDLITADSRVPEWEINDRRGALARRHRQGYQQIRLDGNGQRSPVTLRRVRGWLRTNAAGTELPQGGN